MKINPINNNYQSNNTNFKGSVDKSVVKYLKEFQKDAVRRKPPRAWKTIEIDLLALRLPVILQQLKDFMAKLHPDTKLVARESNGYRYLELKNTKLNDVNTLVYKDEFGYLQARKDRQHWEKQWHDYNEFEKVEKWTELFLKEDPKQLDKNLFYAFIDNIEYDASQGGLFKDYFLNKKIKKAQETSKEFGVESISLSRVEKALRVYNQQVVAERSSELSRKQAKKDLKNVKLK